MAAIARIYESISKRTDRRVFVRTQTRAIGAGLAGLLIIVMLTTGMWTAVSGQESADQSDLTNSPRMLVLYDGRVIRGQISPLKLGYSVVLPAGTISVPYDLVVCEARSLEEAYRKQRNAMVRPTADQHLRLANWCISQKLFESSERELESALALQPNHHQAQRLIRQLSERKPRDSDFIDPRKKSFTDKLIIERELSDVRPIGDLDPKLAQEFISTIEPLLLNGCASTSCHGSEAKNDFQLTPKWKHRGNSKAVTKLNLAAVLGQINRADPAHSSLIAILKQPHGDPRKPIFTGRLAEQHKLRIENWALRTAAFLGPPIQSTPVTEPTIQQANFESAANSNQSPRQIMHPNQAQPLPSNEPEAGRVEQVRRQQARDPFDPDQFNLLKHGRRSSR